MLHFLIGVALCIFIGERLWHYAAIIRRRREERRELRRLKALYAPPTPSPIKPTPVWLAASLVVMMVALATILATHA
jgi:hypothetical protein